MKCNPQNRPLRSSTSGVSQRSTRRTLTSFPFRYRSRPRELRVVSSPGLLSARDCVCSRPVVIPYYKLFYLFI